MAKKETKKYRFNYVMTESQRIELQFLFNNYYEIHKRNTTIGSIIRKLVADEVKRIKVRI